MNTSLEALLTSYRACHNALVIHRTQQFPSGTEVKVNVPGRYVGPGVAVQDGCPADQVAVRLPNGNTWWYPLDCVQAKEVKP